MVYGPNSAKSTALKKNAAPQPIPSTNIMIQSRSKSGLQIQSLLASMTKATQSETKLFCRKIAE